jgi:hypothetical protein
MSQEFETIYLSSDDEEQTRDNAIKIELPETIKYRSVELKARMIENPIAPKPMPETIKPRPKPNLEKIDLPISEILFATAEEYIQYRALYG